VVLFVKSFFGLESGRSPECFSKEVGRRPEDSDSVRKPSCCSRGGVGTRNFERIAAPHPTQVVTFTSRKIELPSKNLSLVRSVSTRLSGFLKNS
jgi:hypothetical protein